MPEQPDDGRPTWAHQRARISADRAEELLSRPVVDTTEASLAVRQAICHALLAIYWELLEAPGRDADTRPVRIGPVAGEAARTWAPYPDVTNCGAREHPLPPVEPAVLDYYLDHLVDRFPSGRTAVLAGRPDSPRPTNQDPVAAGPSTPAGPGADHPAVLPPVFEALLGALLLTARNPGRGAARSAGPPTRPRHVKRAMEAIDADPARPYTVASLADLAGVRVRTLQYGFRTHLGMSPMEYLRSVRLSRAHEDLKRDSGAGVAEVAYRWGFTHLGRFAAVYAERFGESPSRTRDRLGSR